ncbi:MAG: hypothetical protein IPK07_22455 [Deltaproteobacteria bacterium]|nr:hypothetical protein [Deltaproteobacteria bacterium]
MSTSPRSSLGFSAALATALTLALTWWADSSGIRDGARHGLGGAPVGVAVTPDGGRVLVAAADDDAVWVLDAVTGRRLGRQALDGAPLRFVPMRSLGRPVVLFDASTAVCAVHPFRERTLATCFEPGEADVTDSHAAAPRVIGAVEGGDGALVVALARFTRRDPTIRLRRFVPEPGERRWLQRGDSPWVPIPRGLADEGLWPMAAVADGGPIYLVVPGQGRMLAFDSQLALAAEVPVSPSPRDLAISPDGEQAFVVDGPLGELWKIALPSGQVRARVKVGPGAQSVALDARRGAVWVAARSSGELVGLTTDTLAPLARLPVQSGTGAVAVDAQRRRLVASNFRHGTVASWALAELDWLRDGGEAVASPAASAPPAPWTGRAQWLAEGA